MLLWLFIRSIYHLFWVLRSCVYGFPPISEATIELYYTIVQSVTLGINFWGYLDSSSLANHLNQLITINKTFHSEFLVSDAKTGGRNRTNGSKYTDGCSTYMRLFTSASQIGLFPFAAMFLLVPHQRIYFYSYIPGQKSSIHLILYFVWEFYTYCWQISVCYLFWYVQMLFANSTNFWLQQIGYELHSCHCHSFL